ncbi:hypothetical protein [Mobilicoccus pelagius]|uniref:D-inositol 3-phosphate glycosyltransferase n=1 Tax=Mobilicoccus pelagius NBRC 104925 TaxID=1089455 RepID=H5UNQ5_9MICO|nr:hypothetical protein [Mobilicoccus pelagius]GAB47363.1 hypothetical protein MOPEL_009_00530 [Mobilicoccus pelagius NBRC 104925]
MSTPSSSPHTTTSASRPVEVLHLVPGPDRHGVTRHALDLLGRPALADHSVRRVVEDGPAATTDDTTALLEAAVVDAAEAGRGEDARAPHVHLHLTDHLLAPTAGECAEIFVALAARHPVSLTLHDLPQPADGPGRYERRRAAYARMAEASRGVVVASDHERALLTTALAEEGRAAPPIVVVPLPLDPPDPRGPVSPAGPRSLAVFGWLYPGKGHADALEALATLGGDAADVGLVALGEVSPGHEDEAHTLRRRAHELGRTVTVTGHLPDDAVRDALRTAWIPVAPHRHVSASGSIGSWLAAGRRPLVPTGTYVDEIESRCPGASFRYGPGTDHPDLAAAARAALADPSLTWLDPGARLTPDGDGAAAALARAVEDWAVTSTTVPTTRTTGPAPPILDGDTP